MMAACFTSTRLVQLPQSRMGKKSWNLIGLMCTYTARLLARLFDGNFFRRFSVTLQFLLRTFDVNSGFS
jgi:hypothetical protein